MYVYFIQQQDNVGLIKIGYSKDVNERIAYLQTGNPYNLHLLFQLKLQSEKQAREVERKIHSTFEYCRAKGEWFRQTTPLRNFIAFLASNGNITKGLDIAYNQAKNKIRKYKKYVTLD